MQTFTLADPIILYRLHLADDLFRGACTALVMRSVAGVFGWWADGTAVEVLGGGVTARRTRPVSGVGTRQVCEVLQRLWARPTTAIVGAAVLTLLFQVSCTDLSRAALERDELANGRQLHVAGAGGGVGRDRPMDAGCGYTTMRPDGLETHLTRPFAAVVLGLAALLDPWYADGAAVQAAGKLSGPLLYLATSAVLAWGVWRLIGTGGTLLAAIAYLAMPVSPLHFGLQRFDHHALHLLLTALTVSLLLHAVPQDARKGGRLAGLAGTAAGLGIWSGVELLISGAIGGVALGLAWILWGGRRRARVVGCYALGMALTLAAALIVGQPAARWTSLHLDSISAAHVLMGSFVAFGALWLVWWEACGPWVGGAVRAFGALAVSACAALGLWLLVPDFFLGPYGEVDPMVEDLFRANPSDRGIAPLLQSIPGLLAFHLCPSLRGGSKDRARAPRGNPARRMASGGRRYRCRSGGCVPSVPPDSLLRDVRGRRPWRGRRSGWRGGLGQDLGRHASGCGVGGPAGVEFALPRLGGRNTRH